MHYHSKTRSLSFFALAVLTVAAGCSAPSSDASDTSTAEPAVGAEPAFGVEPAAPGVEPSTEEEAAATQGYLRTPAGIFHRDCIVELPDGASIDEDDDGFMTAADGTRTALAACKHPSFRSSKVGLSDTVDGLEIDAEEALMGDAPDEIDDEPRLPAPSADSAEGGELELMDAPPIPATNGWVAASSWRSSRWLRKITANMKVPKKPARGGAVVFLFPAIEPASGLGAILQPVLQYNWDNRNTWAIASWYVKGARAVHSRPFDVKAGDSLAGTVSGSDCRSDGSHCLWKVTTKSRGQNRSGSIAVRSNSIFRDFQGGALEVYNVDNCAQLPASDALFTTLRAYDGKLVRRTPKFGNMYWNRICHATVSHTTTSTTIKY